MSYANTKIVRNFILGDKWIYIKMYCGVQTSDSILIECIHPIIKEHLNNSLIEKWFFIRYKDPDYHLRVRILMKSELYISRIIKSFNKTIKPYIQHGIIWNLEFSTYNRELERYGMYNIENSESYFYLDSEFIIKNFLHIKNDLTKLISLIKYIELQVVLFELKDSELLEFLNKMQNNFKSEFNITTHEKKILSKKYKVILQEYDGNSFDLVNHKLKKIVLRIINLNNNKQLSVRLTNLLSSYIHMTINRVFQSNQRTYEMLIYDFLFRKNKSKILKYDKG